MPDPALSAAIREAYASAPDDEAILHTLEIWHPAFSLPIRVVRDEVALDARLEATAARDPGAVVSFVAYAFDVVPPEQTSNGVPQCVIEIDNVSREIIAQIDLAVASATPVTVIYRAFLASDPKSGPENDPPLEMVMSAGVVTAVRIRMTAGFPDLLNLRFPSMDYDLETFPGLAT